MLTNLWVSIQEFGVGRTVATLAVVAFIGWIFVAGNKGNNGGSTPPPAQG